MGKGMNVKFPSQYFCLADCTSARYMGLLLRHVVRLAVHSDYVLDYGTCN